MGMTISRDGWQAHTKTHGRHYYDRATDPKTRRLRSAQSCPLRWRVWARAARP
jgi:hypothetical protein